MSRFDLWMPVYIGDYLGDTMRLNTVQHGAYLLLLFEYWRQGPLTQNHAQLSIVARVHDPKAWSTQVWPALERYFDVGADGLLHQKRMDRERDKRVALSETRSAAAKKKKGGGSGDGGNSTDEAPPDGPQKPHRGGGKGGANAVADAPSHAEANADLFVHANDPALASQVHNLEPTHARPRYKHNHQEEDSVLRTGASPPPPADARADLWKHGVPLVRALLGKSDAASRAILGRFLRDARDDCPRVLAVLREAADLRPLEPAAWIAKALQNRRQTRTDESKEKLARFIAGIKDDPEPPPRRRGMLQ